jgi:hypothetical protein
MSDSIANKIEDGFVGTVKGVISTIPAASILVSAYEEMQSGIYKRRMDEWKEAVEERLCKLENDVINSLPNNDIFATVLLISAQLALKTNKEKAKLLANAVSNSATTALSEERVIILLNSIEKYTIPHLRLLRFLLNPKEYNPKDSYMGGSTMTIYYDYYPNTDKSLDRIVIRDLYADGFIDTDSLNAMVSSSGMVEKHTTSLGDDMIEFFGIEKM